MRSTLSRGTTSPLVSGPQIRATFVSSGVCARPNESANFSRNFRIKEGISLNVRAEFSNIFNRTFVPNPTVATNFGAAPVKFGAGTANTGLYNTGFGVMNPLAGTTGQRTGSLSLV